MFAIFSLTKEKSPEQYDCRPWPWFDWQSEDEEREVFHEALFPDSDAVNQWPCV